MADEPSARCVLVVEDEADAREMMREIIEMEGCTVIEAANGAEALRALTTSRPCLIVVDLLMPVMDGVQLLEELRSRPALAAIPVVIATSAPHRAPRGVPVLVKPIDLNTLWGWIRRTCQCAGAASGTA
ncbi:MAG TPA: response regulator [Polyangiaceae bacterium]|jgi:CheY-like chemotaxis protein|nr:response regulator [Polyangiaceae bacterium]